MLDDSHGRNTTVGSCLELQGAPSTTYRVTLLDGTEVLDADSQTSDADGSAYVCLDAYVLAGMKVRVSTTGYSRTVTVPPLSVQTDRIGNVVSGAAPAGKSIKVVISRYTTGTYASGTCITRTLTATTSATYSVNVTTAGGFRGGDHVEVTYTNQSTGDAYAAQTRAEHMTIARGSSHVLGNLNHGVTKLELRTSAGVLRGRAYLAPQDSWGGVYGSFATSAGSPVYPRTGDKVVGDFAIDAKMTIPGITITADAATDIVTLTCPGMAGQGARIWVRKRDWSGFADRVGVANASGVRAWDVSADIDLVRGDRLEGTCRYDTGDEIARDGTVP